MSLKAPFWWRNRGPVCWPLLPLAGLFRLVSSARRALYRHGLLKSYRVSVPVIVVGNIAVGGSGKTPVVIWLVEKLRQHGYLPGIVSRGYGGSTRGPVEVRPNSDPLLVGDEPVLLARRTGAPTWVGADRVAAAQALLKAAPHINVIVTDDGLQHYRLARDLEVAVLDPVILGNRLPMPAGPLREPLYRAARATLLLAHGELGTELSQILSTARSKIFAMNLQPGAWYRLRDSSEKRLPVYFQALKTRALAGIGRPERFFETVRKQGISPMQTQAFPDHYLFHKDDLDQKGADALLMTEKDAIKCAPFAPEETWVLPVDATIDEAAFTLILEHLNGSKTT